MKRYGILLSVLALVLASLACQAVTGGGNSGAPTFIPPGDIGGIPTEATPPPVATQDGGVTIGGESEFPMPSDALNVMNVGGVVNFQAKMSLDEARKFYVGEFTKSGYTERTLLTVTSATTFSMVFDGHKSGKAIVIQGVDLGDGSVNINISLQDL